MEREREKIELKRQRLKKKRIQKTMRTQRVLDNWLNSGRQVREERELARSSQTSVRDPVEDIRWIFPDPEPHGGIQRQPNLFKRPPTLEQIRKRKRKEEETGARKIERLEKKLTTHSIADRMRDFSTPIQRTQNPDATGGTSTPDVSYISGDRGTLWPQEEAGVEEEFQQLARVLDLEEGPGGEAMTASGAPEGVSPTSPSSPPGEPSPPIVGTVTQDSLTSCPQQGDTIRPK